MAKEQSGTGYVFNIKDGQVKRAGLTGRLLTILAIIIFLTRYFRDLSFLNLIVTVMLSIFLIWNFSTRNKSKRIPDFLLLSFIGISLVLIPLFNLIGVLYLFLAFISFRLSKPAQIRFSGEGIILQSLWKNFYKWEKVRFVVLKDNLISIELKNEKLIQFEIEDEMGLNAYDFKNYLAEKISN